MQFATAAHMQDFPALHMLHGPARAAFALKPICKFLCQARLHLLLLATGYKSISVLVTRGSLMPLRVGFNQVEGAYTQAPFGSSVEPISADVLELERLQGHQRTIKHSSSMDRQCHTFVVTETAGARAPPLTRVFSR